MSRKPTKGYYVKGHFVAEGSELDIELKREVKGHDLISKTDLKRESNELQKLGEDLLDLRSDAMQQLAALGHLRVIGGRGDRQDLADRLDPVRLAMIIDEGDHGLNRRSNSA